MRQKGSFWNWYKMMGIIEALKCCQNLYQVVVCPFSNDDPGLTLTIFMTGSNLFLLLLYRWQLIEHWVLMYSKVCSNSAYRQHSGERYRTNGPLVLVCSVFHSCLPAWHAYMCYFCTPRHTKSGGVLCYTLRKFWNFECLSVRLSAHRFRILTWVVFGRFSSNFAWTLISWSGLGLQMGLIRL